MAVGRVSLRFIDGNNPYGDDLGQDTSIASSFGIPDNMGSASNDQFVAIAEAAGALVKTIKGETVNDIPDVPCPETDNLSPRRLKFLFADGLSLSVPFEYGDDFAGTVNNITNAIGEATDGKLVCIQLVGEKIKDVGVRFGLNFDGTPVTEGISSTKYSKQFNYTNESGNVSRQFITMNTDQVGSPPQPIAEVVETCAGTIFDTSFSCGKQTVDTRKLIPKYLRSQGDSGQPTSHQIPVRDLAEVNNCAESIIDVLSPAIFCLPYQGENDSRLHLRQGISLPSS